MATLDGSKGVDNRHSRVDYSRKGANNIHGNRKQFRKVQIDGKSADQSRVEVESWETGVDYTEGDDENNAKNLTIGILFLKN